LISSEIRPEVVRLYQEGLSTRKVALHTGVSQTQVRRILASNGVSGRSIKTDATIEAKILELYNSGISSEKISKDFNMNGTTICRIVKRLGGSLRPAKVNKRKYNIIDENWLNEIDSEAKAYFLGFMYADGCVLEKRNRFNITLHVKDIDILYKFESFFFNVKPGSTFCFVKNEPYVNFGITNLNIKNDLIKHGCVPRKTFKLFFPSHLSAELVRHFIRGVFDGDGCISFSSNKTRAIITGSTNFLKQLQEEIYNYTDVSSQLYTVKKCKEVSDLTVGKYKNVCTFLKWIYEGSNYHITRKYNKYLEMQRYKLHNQYDTSDIIIWNDASLYKDYVALLPIEEKEELSLYLFKYFREHGFPYPKYTEEMLQQDFQQLIQNVGVIEGDNIVGQSNAGIKIFQHFCPHYYAVNSNKKPSMIECFYDDNLLMKVIRNRIGLEFDECFNITGNMLRQGMRNSWTSCAASVFKPMVAKTIYNEFTDENSVVLDISAGFGQRMLGACAVKKYIGLDPWAETIRALEKMRFHFNLPAELHCIGSEKFRPSELVHTIDFCFSSPPFFNKEKYIEDKNQAYYNRTLEQFISEWWIRSAKNIYNLLKNDSYFVLNMSPSIAEKMIESVSDLFKLEKTWVIKYPRAHMVSDVEDKFYILKRNG